MASCCDCKGKGYVEDALGVEHFCFCRIGVKAELLFTNVENWKKRRTQAQKLLEGYGIPRPVTHIWRYFGFNAELIAAIFQCKLCGGRHFLNVDMVQKNKALVLPSGKQWKDVNIKADFDLFEPLLPKGPCWKKLDR